MGGRLWGPLRGEGGQEGDLRGVSLGIPGMEMKSERQSWHHNLHWLGPHLGCTEVWVPEPHPGFLSDWWGWSSAEVFYNKTPWKF